MAAGLPSPLGLLADTFATLFGLLAATGLRISEALALDRNNVDVHSGLLAIRHTKFKKSRFVPVHPTTREALERYVQRRDRLLACVASPAFFLSENGTRVTDGSAHHYFRVVSHNIGLRSPAKPHRNGRAPRLHDLRHRFAVKTLIRWYREGRDVERELPKLAISATATSRIRIGTSKRSQNFFSSPPNASQNHRRSRHEHLRLSQAPSGILHRPLASATLGEPPHHHRISKTPSGYSCASRPFAFSERLLS